MKKYIRSSSYDTKLIAKWLKAKFDDEAFGTAYTTHRISDADAYMSRNRLTYNRRNNTIDLWNNSSDDDTPLFKVIPQYSSTKKQGTYAPKLPKIVPIDEYNSTHGINASTCVTASKSDLVWENYGDVNFLDNGCVVAADPNNEGCYYVITCYPVEDVNSDHCYLIQDCYVDTNDTWMDRDAIGNYSGVYDNTDNMAWFAVDCVHYYGGEEFGANVPPMGLENYDDVLYTAEEVEEYMSKYNLPSSVHFG